MGFFLFLFFFSACVLRNTGVMLVFSMLGPAGMPVCLAGVKLVMAGMDADLTLCSCKEKRSEPKAYQ